MQWYLGGLSLQKHFQTPTQFIRNSSIIVFRLRKEVIHMTNIILWVVFGALAGFLADYFDKAVILSWPERIVVGIVGAFIGGFVVNLLTTGTLDITGSNDFNILSIIVAVLGGFVALFVYKRTKHGRHTI